jgi:hypothetical protein
MSSAVRRFHEAGNAGVATGYLACVTLRDALVEQNRTLGVLVSGSEATIEAAVVRATQRRSRQALDPGRAHQILTRLSGAKYIGSPSFTSNAAYQASMFRTSPWAATVRPLPQLGVVVPGWVDPIASRRSWGDPVG